MATDVKDVKEVKGEVKEIDLNALHVDLLTMSTDELYKILNPAMDKGKIVGIVESCKVVGKQRNDEASSFRVKIVFPTEGTVRDVFGNTRLIANGYWVTSYQAITPNTVISFNSNRFAIIEQFGNHDNVNKETGEVIAKTYVLKELVEKIKVIGDNKELRKGLVIAMSNDMSNAGARITAIQDNLFVTLQKVKVIESDI